jgi:hypothetical protein
VFFKAKNVNVLKSVLQDYSLKKLERSCKKSIKEEIKQDRVNSRNRNRERVRQKNKSRDVILCKRCISNLGNITPQCNAKSKTKGRG